MVSSEIKETVALAISAILLASLLYFISFSIGQAYSISATYNTNVHTEDSLSSYREFEKFQGNTLLTPIDVVSAILEYAPSDLNVSVMFSHSDIKQYNRGTIDSKQLDVTYAHLQCGFLDASNGSVCPTTEGNTIQKLLKGQGNGYYDVYLLYGGVSIDSSINAVIAYKNIASPTSAQKEEFEMKLKGSALDGNVTGMIFYKR